MPNISNIQSEILHGPFRSGYLLGNGQVGFVSTAANTLGLEVLPSGAALSGSLDLRSSGVWASNVDQLHEFTGIADATITLPALSQVADGEGIAFQTSSTAARLQLSAAGTDTLPGGFSSTNHLILHANSYVRVIRLGGIWMITTLIVQGSVASESGPENPNPGDLITGAILSLRNERFNPNSIAGFPASAVYGYAYIVSQAGVFDGVSFNAGDLIVAIRPAPVSTSVYENNWLKIAGTSTLASWGGVTSSHIDDVMIRSVLERIGFFVPTQTGVDLLADVTETNERETGNSAADGAIRIGRRGLSEIDTTLNQSTFGERPYIESASGQYSIWTVIVPVSISEATVDGWQLVTTREQAAPGGGVRQAVQPDLTLDLSEDFEIHHALSNASFRVYESVESHAYRENDRVDVRAFTNIRRLLAGDDYRVPSSALPVITRADIDPDDVAAFTATGDTLTLDNRAFLNQVEVTREGLPEAEISGNVDSEVVVRYKSGAPSSVDADYYPYTTGNGVLQYGHSTAAYSIRSRQPYEVRDVVSANADQAVIAVTEVASHFAGWHEYTFTLPPYTVANSEGLGNATVRGGVRDADVGFGPNVQVDRENLSQPLRDELDAAANSYRPDEKTARFNRNLTVSYDEHPFTERSTHPYNAGFAFQPIALTLSGPNRNDVSDPNIGTGGNEYIQPPPSGSETPSTATVRAVFDPDGIYTYFPDSHDVGNVEFPGYNSFFQGGIRIANKDGQATITGLESKIAVSFAYSLPADLSGGNIQLLRFGASAASLELVTGSGLELHRGEPGGTEVQVFFDAPLRTTDGAQQGSVTLAGAGASAQIDFVTPLNAARNHNYDPEIQFLENRHLTSGVQQGTVYHVGDPLFSQLTAQRVTYTFPDPDGGADLTVHADHTYLANEITQDGVQRSVIRVNLLEASQTRQLSFALLIKEQLSTTGNASTFARGHSIGPSDGSDALADTPISLSLLFGPTYVGDISQNPLMSVSIVRNHVHLTDPDTGSTWIDLGLRRSDLQWNPLQVADPTTGITVGSSRVRVSQVQLGTWAPLNRVTKRPRPSQYFQAATDHQPYYGQYTSPGERFANWVLGGNLSLTDQDGNTQQVSPGSPSRIVFSGTGIPNAGNTINWPDDFDPTEYSEFRCEFAHVNQGSIFGNSGYVTQTLPVGREFAIGNNFTRGVLTEDGLQITAGVASSAARLFMIFRK